MAFDLINFLILYTALYQLSTIILGKNFNTKVQYLFFSTILLIPYWTGLNNTYRQFFAVNVFLLISAITFRASMKSKLLLLIPVLSYNAIVLLLPGNMLLTKDSIKKYITIFGLILFPVALVFSGLINFKSKYFNHNIETEIGDNIKLVYLVTVIFAIIAFFVFKSLTNAKTNRSLIIVLIYVVLIFSVAYSYMGGQSYERLFYLFLAFAYPVASIFTEKMLKQKQLGRFLSIHFATITLGYLVI